MVDLAGGGLKSIPKSGVLSIVTAGAMVSEGFAGVVVEVGMSEKKLRTWKCMDGE